MFGKMRVYTVHTKPGAAGEVDDIVFVPEGFSLWAFVFTFVWALVKRCWVLALALFVMFAAIGTIEDAQILNTASIGVLRIGYGLIAGFTANDSLRASLKRRGYTLTDIVTGDSMMRAEQRFFDRYIQAA